MGLTLSGFPVIISRDVCTHCYGLNYGLDNQSLGTEPSFEFYDLLPEK